MVIFLLSLAFAQTTLGGNESLALSRSLLADTFDVSRQVSFQVWGARSEFAVSVAGDTLYFVEHGPEGKVLKSVSLISGAIAVLTKVEGNYYQIATIPNDPNHVLLGEQSGWSNRANKVSLLDLSTGRERPLDIGARGGDGQLLVSRSGAFVATGINYSCHSGDRDCFAEDLAIISLESGKQEYVFKWPILRGTADRTLSDGQATAATVGVTPLSMNVSWGKDECLCLVPVHQPLGGPRPVRLRRANGGQWVETECETIPSGEARRPQAVWKTTVSPGKGHNKLSIPGGLSGRPLSVDAEALFEPGYGTISVIATEGRTVVIDAEPPGANGWQKVCLVILTLKERKTVE